MRNLIEPCLANWDYTPMRAVWLERLNQPKSPGRSWLLAIEGLGAVKEIKAAARLREIALAPTFDSMSRLAAAKALAGLVTKGLEPDAEALAGGKRESGALPQLVAATLLRNHRGEAAAKIQQRLAVEGEPAAAVVALEGLLNDDPSRIAPFLSRVLASPDASVRVLGIEAFRRNPRVDQIAAISHMMDDPNAHVRTGARKALVELAAKAGFGDSIRGQAMGLLARDRWRALEQAALLLATLEHKAAAPRLVEALRIQITSGSVRVCGIRPYAGIGGPCNFSWAIARNRSSLPGFAASWRRLSPRHDRPRVGAIEPVAGTGKISPCGTCLGAIHREDYTYRRRKPIGPPFGRWVIIHEKAAPPELVEKLIDRLTDDGMIPDLKIYSPAPRRVSPGPYEGGGCDRRSPEILSRRVDVSAVSKRMWLGPGANHRRENGDFRNI